MDREKLTQDMVRLDASCKNTILWRNNVGAFRTEEGRFIRYGLANESKNMNKKIKSSDLIGIKRVTITPDMVGQTVGIFVAREVKRPTWVYRGTEREVAQKNFIDIVNAYGGDARFTNDGTC